MQIRALFVDRDGTINVDKGHVHRIADFEYIPRALEALQLATRHRLDIFVVTNQAGIAKGLYAETDFADLTAWMTASMGRMQIRITDVLYCPHHPEGIVDAYRRECDCRKPGPALLQRGLAQAGIDAASAAMIGDKNSDIDAGRRAGMRTYLVQTGYGLAESVTTRADHVVPDLLEAVKHVVGAAAGEASS